MTLLLLVMLRCSALRQAGGLVRQRVRLSSTLPHVADEASLRRRDEPYTRAITRSGRRARHSAEASGCASIAASVRGERARSRARAKDIRETARAELCAPREPRERPRKGGDVTSASDAVVAERSRFERMQCHRS